MRDACIIRGEELSIGYRLGGRGVKHVHDHLDFGLRRGELTCLMGLNGVGKSTLLRTVAGTQHPLGGRLSVENAPYDTLSSTERAQYIGVVLTEKTYIGGLHVEEAVALGRYPHTGFFGRMNRDDRRAVRDAMRAVGVEDKASAFVAELSDGERQKVMIAKVLAQQCPVILLDEPTAFLDAVSRIEVMRLLHRLTRDEEKSVLLSTHDVDQALAAADRLWLLRRGEPMRCGVTEDLVLDGSIDHCFGRDGITFDAERGCFEGVLPLGARIRVVGDSAALQLWGENVLRRLGYTPSEALCPVSMHCQADCIVISDDGGRQCVCRSFEELADRLRRRTDCL